MSFWRTARAAPPYTVRRSPSRSGRQSQGGTDDTVTVLDVTVRRHAEEPYVDVVEEMARILEARVKTEGVTVDQADLSDQSLEVGLNVFPDRQPQAQADRASLAMLVDSLPSPAPKSIIGDAGRNESLNVRLVCVSRGGLENKNAAVRLINKAYGLFRTKTFNLTVDEIVAGV